MIFNTKFFNGIFIILFAQLLGISSAQAKLECYEEMLQKCKNDLSKIQCYDSEDAMEKAEYSKEEVLKADIAWYDENVEFYRKRDRDSTVHTRFNLCYIKEQRRRLLAYTSSNQASKSNQASVSGESSNQSASAAPSNSEASQNKQNYQAAQLARNEANAGKGKKHNSKAEVPECIKPNANETGYKNSCNYSVNISYCFSGVMSGAKGADTQLLADISCQNAQFANTELSAGEDLTGNYLGLTITAMICKSPSQPLDMVFDGRQALGRCSF